MAAAAAPAAAAAKKVAEKVTKKGPGLPERGSWRQRGAGRPAGKSKVFAGDQGKYRRWLVAEFIICVMLLGLSPLAGKAGELGPVRFMKRGTATCAMFIILGLLSSAGRGAARAAGMFGALVTLVLLVDQRSAFGALATTLNKADEGDAEAAAAGDGPDDSTDAGEESVFV